MNKEKYLHAFAQEIRKQPSKDALHCFIANEKKTERFKTLSHEERWELQFVCNEIYDKLPSSAVIPSQETDGLYYLEEGMPIMIGDDWLDKYREDEEDESD